MSHSPSGRPAAALARPGVPDLHVQRRRRVDTVVAALRGRDGRRMTGRELAACLQVPESEVRALLGLARAAGDVSVMGATPAGDLLYVATAVAPPLRTAS